MTKPVAFACLTLLVAVHAHPAAAQLGTENNPPPQNLFNAPPMQRLDTGLGTMAERRAKLAQSKRAHLPVRR